MEDVSYKQERPGEEMTKSVSIAPAASVRGVMIEGTFRSGQVR